MNNLLLIGNFGTGELILIVVVLLLVFGGTKLPELMRGAGRGIREFKDAVNEPVKRDEPKSEGEEPKKEE